MEQTQKLEAWLKQQVPMIEYAQVKIAELNNHRCVITVPFIPQNQNHLQCMYFGALAIGADAAAGLLAMHHIQQSGQKLNILFKDFQAKFLKRAYGDICFTCADEAILSQAVTEAIQAKKRINISVNVIASLAENPEVHVAEFIMTLSMKLAE